MSCFKYSYIDRNGRAVIDPGSYQFFHKFSEGVAGVGLEDYQWGFINKNGKMEISPRFQEVGSFSEGLAAIRLKEKWGFIDKTGQVVIKPEYDRANEFSEGIAVVMKDEETLLIDKTGQVILSVSQINLELNVYEHARFSEGLIDAYDPVKQKYGFIDKAGRFVIEPIFNEAAPFSEGLARVAIKEEEEKLGFINHRAQFVIPPIFNTDADFERNSTDFSEGLASISENLRPTITEAEKFVYIDNNGSIVLFTDFFYAGPFHYVGVEHEGDY